ncbi:ubiquitin-activating enzyme E1, partial [Raphidocelis subcapitata]
CVYFCRPLLESGTLGAKCNTQAVIPRLTENYGASRDPPEKSAPMCTVHSFPHNIDHCLTWARSEFEGMLDKAPAEANSYLADPEKYVDAVRTSADAAAREQLARVVEALAGERVDDFAGAVEWARLKFQDYFHDRIAQLTFTFPEDATTSTGAPFWSAPKRFPTALKFDAADPAHAAFVQELTWSLWDRWTIEGDVTVQEVLDWFESRGLIAYSISAGQSLLYNNVFPKHKERLGKKMSDLMVSVAKQELPPNRAHFDVVVACEDDEGEDVDVPLVSIQYK